MKNLFKILVIALIGSVMACGKGEGGNTKSDPIALSAESLMFLVEGSTKTVTVTGSGWKANGDAAWITVTPAAGEAGTSFTVTVGTNTGNGRESTVTVTNAKEGNDTKTITVKQDGVDTDRKSFISATATYRMDYFNVPGIENFTMFLRSEDNATARGGYYELFLNINAEAPADRRSPDIASGAYIVDEEKRVFTIVPGQLLEGDGMYSDSGIYEYDADGKFVRSYGALAGSTVTIGRNEEEEYFIVCDMKIAGNQKYNGVFEGYVNMTSGVRSDLTEDLRFETLTRGSMGFLGDVMDMGVYVWLVQLTGPDIYTAGTELQGTGTILDLQIYSGMTGDGTKIPDGTYTIVNTRKANSLFPGYGSVAEGNRQGSWLFRLNENNLNVSAPLWKGGTVKISTSGKVHTMEFDLVDDMLNKMTGKFEGEITIL